MAVEFVHVGKTADPRVGLFMLRDVERQVRVPVNFLYERVGAAEVEHVLLLVNEALKRYEAHLEEG